ncbi:hypothetical protein C5167_012738 [Papaver somniferum]|uniref:AIG1-type G domain-containing protein n=1 Tax=Papaver somniferum TaxID=3469 RepID=A0A4Y7J0B6_PAPSO|nr:translocase of chloroplast 90, chloroplastic-like [Papaver somniferum]RZC53876.1 hypothetical protein C5167_012738 [Papaver somniferum]
MFRMNAVKDWISSQLASNNLSRTLPGNDNFIDDETQDEEYEDRGANLIGSLPDPHVSPDTSLQSPTANSDNQPPPQRALVDDCHFSKYNINEKDPLSKIKALQIKFLRLVRRIGQSSDNLLVAQVLYRLHLATLIRVGESDLKKSSLPNDKLRAIAAEQEVTGSPTLDFSLRILVLGKTGVGKSATINSVFEQMKTTTDAFQPSTDQIREVTGSIHGIKVTFIDTPGLLPSSTSNLCRNRKILLSVKRYIKRFPPDIVLYVERLDLINMGYSDSPLLKLITNIFGSAIWFNTILVMTHSSSALPEGPSGNQVNYDSYVTNCSNLVQHYVHQALSDSQLEIPVLLVENHSHCRKNILGEKILPNGQVWRPRFFLLCICTKVLGDANALLKFRDDFQMGPAGNTRLPSLLHLLSTLLRPRSESSTVEMDDETDVMLETEEEEYDQLPPIRILTKLQFEKLTDSQKNEYLDELDYRETLYLKKQLKADIRRQKEKILSNNVILAGDDNPDNQEGTPEAVQLPDIAFPSSFDSDHPTHRYRCLITSDQWLVRPVLDLQGWDHDVGFDGINLETSVEIKRNLHASVMGQLSKDKQDFNMQTECSATCTNFKGSSASAGFDVQTSGKDLVCTVRGDTSLRNFKHNTTGCGISATSFGNRFYAGAKIDNSILIGNRVKLVVNGGGLGSTGQVAYGGSVETIIRGRDFPVRNDKVSFLLTVLSFKKEMVLGGTLNSDFRLGRGTSMSVKANLNSRNMGQICLKTNSSDHMEIGLIAVITMLRFLWKKVSGDFGNVEADDMG